MDNPIHWAFKGKKVLILAGASVHSKLVRAAKELGAYVIVADYLEDSPAKQLADECWMCSITDVDAIVDKCREEQIDGVISGWIDPAQRPYCQICEKLHLPCLGTFEQYQKMTDKHLFKELCRQSGVGVIHEYTLEDCANGNVDYPVFVKPVDSRGSRGQSVCHNKADLNRAIKFAQSESSNGDILIEQYMQGYQEVQVTYFFVNGVPHLIRMTDSYTGTEKDGLSKVVQCAVSPSAHLDEYLRKEDACVKKMFVKLGIQNGPIFMQGFTKNGEFYFFDPGLRFPGVDYELVLKKVFDLDLMKLMVIYALTGKMPETNFPEYPVRLNGKKCAIMFPTIAACNIKEIKGQHEIQNNPNVISYLPRAFVGDKIEWTYNVNQRLCEIDLISANIDELAQNIQKIENILDVLDENGNSARYAKFDYKRIK